MFGRLISLVLGNLRIFSYLSVVALAASVFIWVYKQGYASCEIKQVKSALKTEKEYNETKAKIETLSDAALRRELCKWMRDAKLFECVKTLAPFR
jgi:hypothetical protein